MKTFHQVALILLIIGSLGFMIFHGEEGVAQTQPVLKHGSSALDYFNLGQVYFQGKELGQDDVEAAYYFKKAAEMGNKRAQISLAMMYANGRGVQKDFDEAVYWIKQAYRTAELARQDTAVKVAISWLQQALEYGYAPAQRILEQLQSKEKRRKATAAILTLNKRANQHG